MPSLYEGFPVAAVEALSSGLPVLLSDEITGELSVFSAVEYLPLEDQEQWLQAIVRHQKPADRSVRQQEVHKHGLDIRDTARMLEQVYAEDAAKKA